MTIDPYFSGLPFRAAASASFFESRDDHFTHTPLSSHKATMVTVPCPSRVLPSTSYIKVIDMHTSGEPTRIVIEGYPILDGSTLLEKRANASRCHDKIRRRLMLEPRGHQGMYGAILVQETELTSSGEADIGVLFCHNEGYSTMCGHGTIALGRFLVDTQDLKIFPNRRKLLYDPETKIMSIRLHAPCGIVYVSVPVVSRAEGGIDSTPEENAPDTSLSWKSDSTRRVSYDSVPSFATALDITVRVPRSEAWPALVISSTSLSSPSSATEAPSYEVSLSIIYGGAFYALVSTRSLGFPRGLGPGCGYTLEQFDEATRVLKSILADRKELYAHPTEPDLQYLYGIMVVDDQHSGLPPSPSSPEGSNEKPSPIVHCKGGETGLLFFADRQIDRSPCGSCTSARVALAVKQGRMKIGDSWNYESFLSLRHPGNSFVGTALCETDEGLVVRVEGRTFYTGYASFIVEEEDTLRDGVVPDLL
jgi:trans-L-3-hydroxyproline dehydratase